MIRRVAFALVLLAAAGCGGGGGGSAPVTSVAVVPTAAPTAAPTMGSTPPQSTPVVVATASPGASLASIPLALNVNNLSGTFYGEIVGSLSGSSPRQMVMLPNGDLLIGTGGGTASFAQSGKIYIIANAEAAVPVAPAVFATLTDSSCDQSAGTNTNGIAFAPATGGGTIFVGMECSVWKIPYATGDRVATSAGTKFLSVRTGLAAGSGIDHDVHHTTSLAVAGSTLYVSVGSSCNACIETDATRGVVLKTAIGTPATTVAGARIRNALALAVNPATSVVWAGGAGQDCMVGTQCFGAMDQLYALNGHPYEWMDPLSKTAAAHGGTADYEWPWCEENGTAVAAPDGTPATPPPGTSCTSMIVPSVRAPAYSTIMAATFYAPPANATYAFPSAYSGGMFMSLHGSWHESTSGVQVAVPEVVFVPITSSDTPLYPMDWTNGGSPFTTWAHNGTGNPAPFMNGFQSLGTRIGRPVGLAVGTSGSLFVSDDSANAIYRIRPGAAPASVKRLTATPLGLPSRR